MSQAPPSPIPSSTVSRYVVRDAATFRQEPSIVGTQVLVRDIVALLAQDIERARQEQITD